ASDFAPTETASQMIVDHAGGLHESVADRRAHEPEAPREEIPAHGPRGIRLGRALPLLAPGVAHGPTVDEPPDVRVEAAVLALDRQEWPCIGDRRLDLRAVADDPGVVHEAADSRGGIAGDFLGVERVEGLPIGSPLFQNRRPAQSGLSALEDQELEQQTVPMNRHAPLSIVIGSLELSSGPCAASLVDRRPPRLDRTTGPRPPGPSPRSHLRPCGTGVTVRDTSRRAPRPGPG